MSESASTFPEKSAADSRFPNRAELEGGLGLGPMVSLLTVFFQLGRALIRLRGWRVPFAEFAPELVLWLPNFLRPSQNGRQRDDIRVDAGYALSFLLKLKAAQKSCTVSS